MLHSPVGKRTLSFSYFPLPLHMGKLIKNEKSCKLLPAPNEVAVSKRSSRMGLMNSIFFPRLESTPSTPCYIFIDSSCFFHSLLAAAISQLQSLAQKNHPWVIGRNHPAIQSHNFFMSALISRMSGKFSRTD